MLRLMEIVLFTRVVSRMRAFYEEVLGLEPHTADPKWTAYRTGGAILALHPVGEGRPGYVELTFRADRITEAARMLETRGIPFVGVKAESWGRILHVKDPEENSISIVEPSAEVPEGNGIAIGAATVNARNMAAARTFYHDALGLKVASDTSAGVELDAGPLTLAIRPRSEGASRRSVTFDFAVPDLIQWADQARTRGLHFATAPVDEGDGFFAAAHDPDGNEVGFREPSTPVAIEEELAKPFEDDGAPRRAAIRKPVKKGSRAVSRVALKPRYRSGAKRKRRRPSATTLPVASVRGAGPEGARLAPRRTGDEKKAKVKPSLGRLMKAKRQVSTRTRTAAARASKGRPVKRAAARAGKRR